MTMKMNPRTVLREIIYFKTFRRCYTKLSYRHQISDAPLKPITTGKLCEIAANRYDSEIAIISKEQNKTSTFRSLLADADKLAAGFYNIGLRKGDRIGLWAPNIQEWVIAKYACARGGFILVALNPFYEAPEIEYCINKVGIKAMICLDRIKNKHNCYDILKSIVSEISDKESKELKCSTVPTLKYLLIISDETYRGTYNFQQVLDVADSNAVESIQKNQHSIDVSSASTIQFSSGTTGKPKATLLNHFSSVNNSIEFGRRQRLHTGKHKICLQNPLFHVFGECVTSLASLAYGQCVVLPSITYSPKANLKAIETEQCSIIHGTPTMYVDLINVQSKNNVDINPKIALTGGAPCSPQLIDEILNKLNVDKVRSIYGLTETVAVAFQSLPYEDVEEVKENVGCIGNHLEAKVIDPQGEIVPFGTPGELCIRGYCTMMGYWGDEDKTKAVIKDNWLLTGDRFILKPNGYAQLVGRVKDMIIRGGENIFPKEIEDFLNMHPSILETQVIGLPHDRLGEEVCACVRLKPGCTLNRQELEEFCKGKLFREKIPSVLHIVDSFPKTASGKIQKGYLKQLIVAN